MTDVPATTPDPENPDEVPDEFVSDPVDPADPGEPAEEADG